MNDVTYSHIRVILAGTISSIFQYLFALIIVCGVENDIGEKNRGYFMNFLLYITIVILGIALALSFVDYKVGIVIPILIGIVILIIILRAILIRRKNNY